MAETWKMTYEYLLTSFEEEALIMLSSIEELTKNMLETSIKLKQDAKIAGDEVKNISNAAKRQKEKDMKIKKEIDEKRFELLSREKIWENNNAAAKVRLEDIETEMEKKTKNVEKAERSVSKWGIISIFVPFTKKMYQNAQKLADIERKGWYLYSELIHFAYNYHNSPFDCM